MAHRIQNDEKGLMLATAIQLLCCLAVSSGATLSIRPPTAPERVPAEFEPVQAVMVHWRCRRKGGVPFGVPRANPALH